MTVKNSNGKQVALEQQSPKFGSITLGIPQPPDGNCNEATEYLRDTA